MNILQGWIAQVANRRLSTHATPCLRNNDVCGQIEQSVNRKQTTYNGAVNSMQSKLHGTKASHPLDNTHRWLLKQLKKLQQTKDNARIFKN